MFATVWQNMGRYNVKLTKTNPNRCSISLNGFTSPTRHLSHLKWVICISSTLHSIVSFWPSDKLKCSNQLVFLPSSSNGSLFVGKRDKSIRKENTFTNFAQSWMEIRSAVLPIIFKEYHWNFMSRKESFWPFSCIDPYTHWPMAILSGSSAKNSSPFFFSLWVGYDVYIDLYANSTVSQQLASKQVSKQQNQRYISHESWTLNWAIAQVREKSEKKKTRNILFLLELNVSHLFACRLPFSQHFVSCDTWVVRASQWHKVDHE